MRHWRTSWHLQRRRAHSVRRALRFTTKWLRCDRPAIICCICQTFPSDTTFRTHQGALSHTVESSHQHPLQPCMMLHPLYACNVSESAACVIAYKSVQPAEGPVLGTQARMAAAAAEVAAARAEGARVALETELSTVKQREKEKVVCTQLAWLHPWCVQRRQNLWLLAVFACYHGRLKLSLPMGSRQVLQAVLCFLRLCCAALSPGLGLCSAIDVRCQQTPHPQSNQWWARAAIGSLRCALPTGAGRGAAAIRLRCRHGRP